MNEQIKKDWIAALRSDKYKQGRGTLQSDDQKFCCLGVLADVMGLEWQERGGETGLTYDPDYDDIEENELCTGSLPQYVCERVDFHDDQQQALIKLNDGTKMTSVTLSTPESPYDKGYAEGFEPKSFAYIANYIEENF